MQLLLFCWYRA